VKIIRGDYKEFKIIRKTQDGEIIDEAIDKMYFTVKKSCYLKDYLFQKTLDNGIIYDETNKCYIVKIKPEDTNDLSFDTYYYDVEIKKDDEVKTLIVDTFVVEKEVTHSGNEG